MKYISSTSATTERARLRLFDVTRNVDLASVDVQNRVNQALGRLSQRSQEYRPSSSRNRLADSSLARACIGRQYYSLFLSNYLDVYVKDSLSV